MTKKRTKPTKAVAPARQLTTRHSAARPRKITPQRARTGRRDQPNTPQQARTLFAKGKFLADFAWCGNVLRSAAAAGIHRRTVYTWLAEDTQFKGIYEQALNDALDRLEEEARRRAVDGVMEPVVSGGNLITHVRKYSDTLLITLLKGKRPDTYRDRHEHTGKDGKALFPDPNTLTDAQIDAAILAEAAAIQARAR